MNFVPAVGYHFCLALPAVFTQPGDRLLAEPCISETWFKGYCLKCPLCQIRSISGLNPDGPLQALLHLLVLEPLLGLLEGVVRLAENGLAILGDRLVDRGDGFVSLFGSVLRQFGEVIY